MPKATSKKRGTNVTYKQSNITDYFQIINTQKIEVKEVHVTSKFSNTTDSLRKSSLRKFTTTTKSSSPSRLQQQTVASSSNSSSVNEPVIHEFERKGNNSTQDPSFGYKKKCSGKDCLLNKSIRLAKSNDFPSTSSNDKSISSGNSILVCSLIPTSKYVPSKTHEGQKKSVDLDINVPD